MTRTAAVVAATCTALAAQADVAVVATVGASRISLEQFTRVLNEMRRSGNLSESLRTMRPEGRAEVLDRLIGERLFALAARDEGFERRPEVKAEIEEAALRILARRYAEARGAVTDAAARAYYAQHPEVFRSPRRVKARHILLRTQADADAVLQALQSGAPFETLAAERSAEADTAKRGGDLGWIPRGLMVAPFEEAAFSLQPGQISGVVKTNFGFHVIRVDDIDVEALPPFEAVRDEAARAAAGAQLARVRQQLTAKYPVAVNRDVLAGFGK